MAIQPANPQARRRAVATVAVAAISGLLLIAALKHHEQDLIRWLENNILWLAENPVIVIAGGVLLAAPIWALTCYLLVYAKRGVDQRRFPPEGYDVTRDTRILEGTTAVRRARVIQALSILLFCAASAIPLVMWCILRALA